MRIEDRYWFQIRRAIRPRGDLPDVDVSLFSKQTSTTKTIINIAQS